MALVYDAHGSARIEDGPKRLFLFRSRLVMLTRHSANQSEYLVVKHRDGRIEHVQGPCVMFLNPIAHLSIKKKDMISLDANEALVVYKQDSQTQKVERYIKYGPTLFMPMANEWLHSFSWHGTDPANKTRLIPNSKHFERLQIIPDQFYYNTVGKFWYDIDLTNKTRLILCKEHFDGLQIIPDQFYYNVDEVRTADDALIRVKLMIFYELKDIELMLNATKDPIADFINCVCADTVAFAAKYTYIEFIEHSVELNDLASFPQLTERSKSIGYSVSKVVFRGYLAHDKLQKLHDGAIEVRTKLKIAYESEEQEQNMTDMKLKNEKERIDFEQKIELEELKHKQEMEKTLKQHKLDMEMKSETEKRRKWETERAGELGGKKACDNQQLDFYKNLHGLGVDLNQYIQALSPRPEKITRIVAPKNTANLHLHHQ